SSLILAPVCEEISIRGWLSNNKIVFFCGSIILFFLIVVKFNHLIFLIYLIINYLHFLNYKNKKVNKDLMIYISSFLFAILHHNEIKGLDTFVIILMHFFVGNFLSYLILKYSILYSILAHFVINFIIIVLFMLPILFVDFSKKQYE